MVQTPSRCQARAGLKACTIARWMVHSMVPGDRDRTRGRDQRARDPGGWLGTVAVVSERADRDGGTGDDCEGCGAALPNRVGGRRWCASEECLRIKRRAIRARRRAKIEAERVARGEPAKRTGGWRARAGSGRAGAEGQATLRSKRSSEATVAIRSRLERLRTEEAERMAAFRDGRASVRG